MKTVLDTINFNCAVILFTCLRLHSSATRSSSSSRKMKPPTKRRKLNTVTVEEVKFDDSARADYLTGFHKRKVARIKHAQEQAAKKEKEERRVEREEVS
jgi:hypothetical protein